MNGFNYIEADGKPIKAWTRGVPIEDAAMAQLRNVAALPFIHKHIAVMPDVHWGKGATVGPYARLRPGANLGAGAKVDALKAAAETQKAVASQKSWLAEAQRIEREARSKAFQNDAQIAALQHTLAGVDGDIGTSRSTIARLQAELGKYLLRAPISGRLADVGSSRVGSYVAEGQKLATILPPGDLIIVADFPPSVALGRIQRGQQARMRLDGFPWAQYGTLPAAVTNVAGEIHDGLVRVELSVEGKPGEGMLLQHGLPGSLEVTVEEASPFRLLLRSAGVVLAGGPRPGTTQ